jgi:hypothetical protein
LQKNLKGRISIRSTRTGGLRKLKVSCKLKIENKIDLNSNVRPTFVKDTKEALKKKALMSRPKTLLFSPSIVNKLNV